MPHTIEDLVNMKTTVADDLVFMREIKRALQTRFLVALHAYVEQQKLSLSVMIPQTTVGRCLLEVEDHLELEKAALELFRCLERTISDSAPPTADPVSQAEDTAKALETGASFYA